MMDKTELISLGARIELARRHFYDYCLLMYPQYYSPEYAYLKAVCDDIENFMDQDKKKILVISMPPRHRKSATATNFTEWAFGKKGVLYKIMTGSYNEDLSSTFARKVRDTIQTEKVSNDRIVYGDIFPEIQMKYGEASAAKWALDGSSQPNYLATSPTGTATGFGANLMIIDDIIKNAEEAYNDAILEKHWSWFTNTMMQRLEGADWKVIIIMTRWAKGDLAGRIIEEYGDIVETITFKAVQDDGTMLCPAILTREDYDIKTKNMNDDIREANYNQQPMDVKGRLYEDFIEWDELPDGPVYNQTDTADKGSDFFCSIDYVVHKGEAYIKDLVFTDEPLEITEPLTAEMLMRDEVEQSEFESNNGGRGVRRNVERILAEKYHYTKTVFTDNTQTHNKEARILSSSAWVPKHIFMPPHWKEKYPKFFKQVTNYQKKGKNEHDDGPDVLARIYEKLTNDDRIVFYGDLDGGGDEQKDRIFSIS